MSGMPGECSRKVTIVQVANIQLSRYDEQYSEFQLVFRVARVLMACCACAPIATCAVCVYVMNERHSFNDTLDVF